MSDIPRKPKFEFMSKPRRYGKLDISNELIVCTVGNNGRLIADSYPISWEMGVNIVGTAEYRASEIKRIQEWNVNRPERQKRHEDEVAKWNAEHPNSKPRKPTEYAQTPLPGPPKLLIGLNEDRDSYEIVYDPHDLGGQVDPMMLLNFRRKV